MEFPKEIKEIVDDTPYIKDNIGRSDDITYIFENKYILKISKDSKRLLREKEKIDWISNYIKGPKSLLLVNKNNYNYYLRECLNGESLISKRFIQKPILLIEILSKIIKILRYLDNIKCPFKSHESEGNDFVHGDLCLPNIFVNEKNEFIGFIDVENAGKGDKWYDYAWLLWSFEYNLKTNKYNQILLNHLGIEMDINKYNQYIPFENRKELEKFKN